MITTAGARPVSTEWMRSWTLGADWQQALPTKVVKMKRIEHDRREMSMATLYAGECGFVPELLLIDEVVQVGADRG